MMRIFIIQVQDHPVIHVKRATGFCHGLQNNLNFVFVTIDFNSHRLRHVFTFCVHLQGRIAKRRLCKLTTNAGVIESSIVSAPTVGKDRSHPGDTSKQGENFVWRGYH